MERPIPSAAALLLAILGFLANGTAEEATEPLPHERELRRLVEDHAHAIETNNRELALWYVHPQAPSRPELDAKLRHQLASYLERARVSSLATFRLPDGTTAASVNQDILRVIGVKLTRRTRGSIYRFRKLGDSWRIWAIDEPSG